MSATPAHSARRHSFCILHSAFCIAFAALSAKADGPNLIVNGDFEAKGYTDNYRENCGSAYLIGWDCSQAGICTPKGTYLATAIQAYDNSAWAFLKKASWFSQEIEAEAGPYRLEYDFCGRPGYLANADVTITFGDTVVTNFTGDGGSANGSVVAHHVIDFVVAESGTYTLKFAQSTTADRSPAFDNITLVQTVRQSLKIASVPKEIGTVTPAYGLVSTNANAVFYCSAPATVATPYASWVLAGWKYYENGVLVNTGTTTSTNITIQANVRSVLEWQWNPGANAPISVAADGSAQYETIADALAAFGSGDSEIVLLPGSYPVAQTVVLDKPMTFRSSTGDWRDVTVYRTGTANFPVFRIDDADVVLSGITITNGYSTADKQGGAIYTTAAATIRDCRITQNAGTCATINLADGAKLLHCRVDGNVSKGGSQHMGIYMTGATTLVEDCEVINNDAGSVNYSSAASAFRILGGTVRRCVVTNNFNSLGSYGHDGAIKTDGPCLIENCLIAGNTSGYGSGWETDNRFSSAAGIQVSAAGCIVRNCTVADNMGFGRGGIRVHSDGYLRLENSIVWGNVDIVYDTTTTAANTTKTMTDWNISNLSQRYATNVCSTIFFGEGSLATDPLFVDAEHGDYRLAANSPCRNAGYARPGDDVATDLAGNARVVGGAIDLGCFEGTSAEPSVTPSAIQQDVYLTAGGDIAEALSHCGEGSTLHVGPGDYPVAQTLVITGGVHIVATDGPATTSLFRAGPHDSGDRFRMIVALAPGFVLSGFTVSNTFAEVAIGQAVAMRGGTITNCVFRDNYIVPHQYGGGLVFAMRGTVIDTRFEDNYGNGGAGGGPLALFSGAVATGCDFFRNSNPNNNSGGSAVQAHKDAIVRRCRFIGNRAAAGSAPAALRVASTGVLVENCLFACNTNSYSSGVGAIAAGANDLVVKNCTFADNYGQRAALFLDAKKAVVANSLFAENIATGADAASKDVGSAGNAFLTNSLFTAAAAISGANFVDCRHGAAAFADSAALDYTLTSSSPAVDNGAPITWSEDPPVDLAGNPRVRNIVDIGCYEFYPPATLDAAYTVSGNDVAGGDVTFSAVVTGDDLDGLECRWRLVDATGNGTWTAWSDSTDYTLRSPAPGRYTLELEVRNGNGETDSTDMDGAVFAIAATEVFVAPRTLEDHEASAPYTTRATAATNIADVIAFCGTGTKVTVLDGEHAVPESADFVTFVEVRSESGNPARCSLYRPGRFANGTKYRLLALNAGGVFSGFTVSNAHDDTETRLASALYAFQATVSNCVFAANNGTALFNDGGLVRDCRLTGNYGHSGSYGTAYCQRGADAVAEDCAFNGNFGGSYYISGTISVHGGRISRCTVVDNDITKNAGATQTAGFGVGGIAIRGNSLIENCLIARNSAVSTTGGISINGSYGNDIHPRIVNCTIVSNAVRVGTATGVVVGQYSSMSMTNCIVFANADLSDALRPDIAGAGTLRNLSHTLVQNTMAASVTTNCFFADPLFKDFEAGDFRLKSRSPCINKGAPFEGMESALDLLCRKRLFGPAIDLGCYELPFGRGTVVELR